MDNVIDRMSRRDLRRLMRSADPTIFEQALQFLENDPKMHWSGHRKEVIWHLIRHYPLDAEHIARLEEAALNYLYRPMTPEFRRVCVTMAHIATESFWEQVRQGLQSDNLWVRINAGCLYPYVEGVAAGEKVRLENKKKRRYHRMISMAHSVYRVGYRPFAPEAVLNILRTPENWVAGQVVKLSSQPEEVIVSLNPTDHKDVLALDYGAMKPDVVLPKLEMVLFTGELDLDTITGWLYAIYALGMLGDKQAIPVLEKFLEDRIAYKFESSRTVAIKQEIAAALEKLSLT